MTYDLTLHEKHAIFETNHGDRVLIDTGVPYTFHTANQWEFEGTTYSTKMSMGGIDVNSVSELVGTGITTLLGGDILSKYKVGLSYQDYKVSFEPLNFQINQAVTIPIQMYSGFMLIQVVINGHSVLGYLDTGAKLSYVSNQLKNGLTPNTDKTKDFYIGIGAYETETYTTNAYLSNGESFEGTYGVLPDQLASRFFGGQRQAIIGSDLFLAYKTIWLDYANNCIHLEA